MKGNIFGLIFFTAASMMAMSCSVKSMDTPAKTVSVYGSGQVAVKSDMATIELAVATSNHDVNLAVEENTQKTEAVKAALIEAGIDSSKITNSNYYVYQEQNYSDRGPASIAYKVTSGITIVTNETSNTGFLIAQAIKAGANSVSNISYSVKNTDQAVKQARLLALKQAEEKALTLASASGRELGRIVQISEENSSEYPRTASSDMEVSKNIEGNSSTTPTDTFVTVTVHTVYQLK